MQVDIDMNSPEAEKEAGRIFGPRRTELVRSEVDLVRPGDLERIIDINEQSCLAKAIDGTHRGTFSKVLENMAQQSSWWTGFTWRAAVVDEVTRPVWLHCIRGHDGIVISVLGGHLRSSGYRNEVEAVVSPWCTDSRYRGEGLGSKLLNAFEDWAREAGASHCFVSAFLPFDGRKVLGAAYRPRETWYERRL